MKTITEALKWRYATKAYDATKRISDEDFAEIENILQYIPTSTNFQPSHFIIASDEAGKERVAKGAKGAYIFNYDKIKNASHVIVFCSKVYVDDNHLKEILEQEEKDNRFIKPHHKEKMHNGRKVFLDVHRYNLKDEAHWHAKQTYIAVGAVLLGAAELGIDATPMEGFDQALLDEEFNLRENGYTAQVIVALGYRDESKDFNLNVPKSRLSKNRVITKA
ncbi:dihydropteridine reductase [Campylobacter blaseri]|uniref:Oxygen-insensitive NAD(P)H nitroreductase n=1 Tax=Campylobacter blaseri TaxID=2042961 RepID=A0A2P8R3R6_9BACT|nr:oxygen-insensitive NAD(P)H nitroreductase [Campylobacter blaseri]PSM53144.1 oxygen-insensitive NAD(P)H nitroreductase [Campylobacter blaseri]PSM54610.1 oxygen-insensitive NAD(P)H nitroreductase [Campylobacter blaseri]QKF86917.1 dihydropteridine reductase [Campylobacter blaseri]